MCLLIICSRRSRGARLTCGRASRVARCSQADPVDPKPQIEEACKAACSLPAVNYEKCKDRIAAKGTGNCEAWYFDYWK